MTRELRRVDESDRTALAAFLDRHADTTLFLRGNLAEAGLGESTHPFGGVWIGAFEGDALAAIATHFNGGNIVVAGDAAVRDAAQLAARTSGRPVRGVVGPWQAARSAVDALALDAPPALESRERLYRLDLDRLVVPEPLASGALRCRGAREEELDALADWRMAYEAENLAIQGRPGQRAAALESVARAYDTDRLFVLDDAADAPVASSAFNASADGIVQVGGVFTPPGLRRRGYGRSVVAGSLLLARARGAHRSVLFTGTENVAAQRAYEALGYEEVGDYGIVLF